MELLSSDIKASLQPRITEEEQRNTSPTKIDCCLSKINQAIDTIEKVLFYNNKYNQNTDLVAECNDNSNITTEDKVKVLNARVASLEQQLLVKESELQELKYTNQDLIAALKPDMLTLESAKELAKNIFVSNELTYEYLAKLLSGIYNSTVEASELAPTDKNNNRENSLNAQEDKLMSMHKALKEKSTVLKCESISVRNKAAEIKAKSQNIKARIASFKNI